MEVTHRIFIDEAGTPTFKLSPGQAVEGYVVTAVCIPTSASRDVLAMLPAADSGGLLKFSDARLSPQMVNAFIARVLEIEIDIYSVTLQTSSKPNIDHVNERVEFANEQRKRIHAPSIRPAGLFYMLCMKDAAIECWARTSSRHQADLTGFGIVLDDAPLAAHDKELIRSGFFDVFDGWSVECREFSWSNEHEEPLLNVPDIISGVCLRQARYADVDEAATMLLAAHKAGRIRLQDGLTTNSV